MYLVIVFWSMTGTYSVEIATKGNVPSRPDQHSALLFRVENESAATEISQMAKRLLEKTDAQAAFDNLDVFIPHVSRRLRKSTQTSSQLVHHLSARESDYLWARYTANAIMSEGRRLYELAHYRPWNPPFGHI